MGLQVLADENVDHRVVHRLEHYGHEVEHVDDVVGLGKGATDERIAGYSSEREVLLLTGDDDFLSAFDEDDYFGLLFVEDETLSSETVADTVHEIANAVDHDQATGVFYVSRTWL